MYRTTTMAGTNPVNIRAGFPPQWQDAVRVEQLGYPYVPVMPSVEAWGPWVFAAYSDNFSNDPIIPSDVWRRQKDVNMPNWTLWPLNQSSTPYNSSDWPTTSTFRVTTWREVSDVGDAVWARYDGEPAAVPLYSAGRRLFYPHVNMALEQPQITRMFFTEGICYGIYAAKYVRAFHQFDGGPTARYPFYSVAVGGDEPSPYCAYRDGAKRYGKWAVDFAEEKLGYSLKYLDPAYRYLVRAVFYQESGRRIDQRLTLGDSIVSTLSLQSGQAETVWADVPQRQYRDAQAELVVAKLQGDCAVLAGLDVYEYEADKLGGGPQGGPSARPAPQLDLSAPALFKDRVAISYGIPCPTRVTLVVLDLAGRKVRTLLGPGGRAAAAGVYSASWDARDDRGSILPDGVYFCRLETDVGRVCRKVVLAR